MCCWYRQPQCAGGYGGHAGTSCLHVPHAAYLHDDAVAVLKHAQLGIGRVADRQQVAALLLRAACAPACMSGRRPGR